MSALRLRVLSYNIHKGFAAGNRRFVLAGIKEAMRRTGHAPGDSWMVGDHHTDLAAARRASIRSIFLQSGFGHPGTETPDLVFPDFPAFAARFLPGAGHT